MATWTGLISWEYSAASLECQVLLTKRLGMSSERLGGEYWENVSPRDLSGEGLPKVVVSHGSSG